MSYFSEREHGERPRDHETISEGALGGILALVLQRRRNSGRTAARLHASVEG